jgi:hypothetical protein
MRFELTAVATRKAWITAPEHPAWMRSHDESGPRRIGVDIFFNQIKPLHHALPMHKLAASPRMHKKEFHAQTSGDIDFHFSCTVHSAGGSWK